jgi:hypothetical protein
MKTIYITSTMIIVATIGFALYVWYDTKKFEESLGPLPGSPKVEVRVAPSATAFDDSNPQIVNQQEHSEQQSKHTYHPNMSQETVEMSAHDISVRKNDTDSSLAEPSNSPVKKPKKLIHFDDMTIDQKIKKLRHALVDINGNIPEVEEFLSLYRKEEESRVYLPNNLSVLDMPIEEQIRLAELHVKLYPMFPENKIALNNLRAMKARQDSGQAIPITQYPPEVWHEIATKARVIVDIK